MTTATVGQIPAVNPPQGMTKYSQKMKTLHYGDTIDKGIYAGDSVGYCIKRYGKKAILELLRYYNFCESIMEDYHFHLEPHKNDTTKDDMYWKTEMTMANKEEHDAEPLLDTSEEKMDSEDAIDSTDRIGLAINDLLSKCGRHMDDVLYDPEDDERIGADDSLMTGIWSQTYEYTNV